MSNDSYLRRRILIEGARGNIPEDEAHKMLEVLSGTPIVQRTQSKAEKSLGANTIYRTLDINGNVLIAGDNYLLRDQKVKVLREEQGAGNMLDVYMRVFYLNTSLEEKFEVVDGKYPKGILEEVVYKSIFKPTNLDLEKTDTKK